MADNRHEDFQKGDLVYGDRRPLGSSQMGNQIWSILIGLVVDEEHAGDIFLENPFTRLRSE